MADQETQTAVTAPVQDQVQQTTTESGKTGGKTYSEAEVQQMIKDRLEREKQSQDKRLEAEKKAAEEAKLKEQNEWKVLAEKHQAELEKTKAELAARDLAEKKRTIAAKYNIPDQLATRLVGSTDEEIEADAKALAETLPKAEQKKASPGPTHPGEGNQIQESDFQAKQRLMGQNADVFSRRSDGVRLRE
jgi:hypothetical protein